MRVPLGVVGIIYESRPNVTADAAGLCLKAGNATILRGGSEAIRSNQAIAACVHEGLRAAGLPETAVQVVATTDRAAVGHLIADDEARRRHRAARRQGPDRAHRARGEGAGDQAPRRRVPRVRRRRRRRRHGDPHRRQREDAALLAVQHDGDAARPRGHRRARAAAAVRRSTRTRASSCAAASARARSSRR